MINSLPFGMIHTCIITRKSQNHRLNFTAGAVEFTEGQTLQGASTQATGIIQGVTLQSGAWGSGTAAGYLILYDCSGEFGAETITEITPVQDEGEGADPVVYGTATGAGPATQETDELGQGVYTSSSHNYLCRFDLTQVSGAGGGYTSGPDISGRFITGFPFVFLPANADVKIGDFVTSIEPEFGREYEVNYVKYCIGLFAASADHIEAYLQGVSKVNQGSTGD